MDREALKASGLTESRGNGFSPENLLPKTFRIGSRLDCSWRQPSDMSSYYPYYEKAEARKNCTKNDSQSENALKSKDALSKSKDNALIA